MSNTSFNKIPDDKVKESPKLKSSSTDNNDDDNKKLSSSPNPNAAAGTSNQSDLCEDYDNDVFDEEEDDADDDDGSSMKYPWSTTGGNHMNKTFSNDKVREIGRRNSILMHKILSNNNRPNQYNTSMYGKNGFSKPSSAEINRRRGQQRIDRDNQILLKKIQSVKSTSVLQYKLNK